MNTTARKDEQQVRRRRRNSDLKANSKLGVDPALLNFDKFEYRWTNDTPGRLVAKTKHDDWDHVPNEDGVKDDSTTEMVSVIVGTNKDGSPMRAYLLRKPKKFFEEDKAEKLARLDEQLQHLRRGNDADGGSQGDYVPHSGISM